jgi:ABC-type multidrug transport system ATPase subunit
MRAHDVAADELAVEAVGLEKAYGTLRVLDGVELGVARGSVFALLGPNGAGKTTIVRILATLLRPDAGQARVAGFDVVRDRRGCGGPSASPASTRPWTSCRPARRTCG